MNLSDFINKDSEKEVINKLENVHNDDIKYYLTLWYKDGTVSTEDIKRFLLDYESNLHFKTKIKDLTEFYRENGFQESYYRSPFGLTLN